jgi:hypothetical protein
MYYVWMTTGKPEPMKRIVMENHRERLETDKAAAFLGQKEHRKHT